jgi:hypothetical protein
LRKEKDDPYASAFKKSMDWAQPTKKIEHKEKLLQITHKVRVRTWSTETQASNRDGNTMRRERSRGRERKLRNE